MAEWFDMGKYSAFIWPSYGATLLIIGGLSLWILRQRYKIRAHLRQMEIEQAQMENEQKGDLVE